MRRISKFFVAAFTLAAVLGQASLVFANNVEPVLPNSNEEVALSEKEAEEISVEEVSENVVVEEEKQPEVVVEVVKKYTADRVNFRKEPGTEADILTVLEVNVEVVIRSTVSNGEWSFCELNDVSGFIKSEFLSDKPVEVRPPQPQVAAPELLTWSTVKSFIKTGVIIPVLDLWSGLTYNVKSFSNGSHSDVEPATSEDTAIMKRTYGGKWDWDGRPVVVTIGGRRIVAAINGMPHGGGVVSGNGMNGQVCLHFKGSHVHNGNYSYERTLQNIVNVAWNLVN